MLLLHLFHGRNRSDEDLDDWGFDGPVLQIEGYHVTYTNHVRVKVNGDWHDLTIKDECVQYDGKWYGDYSIFTPDSNDIHHTSRAEPLDVKKLISPATWEARTLKLFESRYGLAEHDVAPLPTDQQQTPEEYVEWYAGKYDLDRLD